MESNKNKLNEPKVKLLIREMMKKRGINAEELAKQLGITENSVYVRIRGNITINALYEIAQVLNCEIADFFPVPYGYTHWMQGNNNKKTGKGIYFCPKCGTKFQVDD